jgi:ABC-type amino acid transport substrate-binding protein
MRAWERETDAIAKQIVEMHGGYIIYRYDTVLQLEDALANGNARALRADAIYAEYSRT